MDVHINDPFQQRPIYAAYMIRLWQDSPNGPWRASAQSVQTGEIVRFGSLQDLFTFFMTQSQNTTDVANKV